LFRPLLEEVLCKEEKGIGGARPNIAGVSQNSHAFFPSPLERGRGEAIKVSFVIHPTLQ